VFGETHKLVVMMHPNLAYLVEHGYIRVGSHLRVRTRFNAR
jgi:hypothetical protein